MDNDEINKLFSDSVSDITPISEYSSDYLEQSKHLRNEKNINGNPSKVEKNSPVKNINNKIQNGKCPNYYYYYYYYYLNNKSRRKKKKCISNFMDYYLYHRFINMFFFDILFLLFYLI